MRAFFASLLMAFALLWATATGGRTPPHELQQHFPAQSQTLSPWGHSADTATFTPSGEHARSLLTTGRQSRRGPGFQPLPFLLPAPVQLAIPIAELAAPPTFRCASLRGARPLAHGPRAPPV